MGRRSARRNGWAQRTAAGHRSTTPPRQPHPLVGRLELDCEVLLSTGHDQLLIVHTARPGTEAYERLELLRVLDTQDLSPGEGAAARAEGARDVRTGNAGTPCEVAGSGRGGRRADRAAAGERGSSAAARGQRTSRWSSRACPR
ncbi:hypothetical protein AB0H77_15240 [Streptomyces sp. NPDC050844]|uniref:MmyB family transcriptional regulator n=1 Tax=Streptomyces sp. NPDC050844 TaxID=3155790 RepID=UPI0033FCD284